MKREQRMVGADVIKIVAAVLVIFTHHKSQSSSDFYLKYGLLFLFCLLVAIAVSVGISRYGKEQKWNQNTLYWGKRAPFLMVAVLFLLYKFAVSFFFIISGFMLTVTIEREEHPVKEWYRPHQLLPRILRFYLPFIPVLIAGLFIHIFLQNKTYDTNGILKRIFLGGFAPGSYYIVVMVQFLFLFPFLYLIVKRWRGKGICFLLLMTFVWDLFATCWMPISDKSYKFCALRLIPQISLGIYARLTKLKKHPPLHWGMLLIGLLCYLLFDFSPLRKLTLFYQWTSASLFVAIFLYPIVVYVLSAFQEVSYTESKFSRSLITCSNATYHIFLVQMLLYNMILYAWNEQVNNILITMPMNLLVCFAGGLLYYRWLGPVENRVLKGLKARLIPQKKTS